MKFYIIALLFATTSAIQLRMHADPPAAAADPAADAAKEAKAGAADTAAEAKDKTAEAPTEKTDEEKAAPVESAAKAEAKEMKKDPMENFGRAERVAREKYDHEAMEVVGTLKASMSDHAEGHAERTANNAASTADALKEGKAGLNDRIA